MKYFIYILLVVAAMVLIYMIVLPDNTMTPDDSSNLRQYASSTIGLSFKYPEKYLLLEHTEGTSERTHKSIVLIEDTPTNRQLISGEIVGEAPTVIGIDVFQNNLDRQSAENWIRNTSASNFKLGKGVLASSTISGMPALEYSWSGLYEGKSSVTANDKNVYMFSVTHLTPADQILEDFGEVIQSVRIQ